MNKMEHIHKCEYTYNNNNNNYASIDQSQTSCSHLHQFSILTQLHLGQLYSNMQMSKEIVPLRRGLIGHESGV